MASRYNVSMVQHLIPGDLAAWDLEYWYYMGVTENPLISQQVLPLRVALYLQRQLKGRVTDKEGKVLPPVRVQVWYTPDPIPGLTRVHGYSVTHTREDGSFRAEGVGPGPYRITVQDRANRVIEVKDVPEASQDLTIIYAPSKRWCGSIHGGGPISRCALASNSVKRMRRSRC